MTNHRFCEISEKFPWTQERGTSQLYERRIGCRAAMVICGRSRLSAAGGYWSKTGNFKHLQSSSKTFYTLYKLIYIYIRTCIVLHNTHAHTHIYIHICICMHSNCAAGQASLDPAFRKVWTSVSRLWWIGSKRRPGPQGPQGPQAPQEARFSALYILDVQHRYKSDGIWMHSLPTWHRLIERISDIAYYRHVMLDADRYPHGKASNYQWYA